MPNKLDELVQDALGFQMLTILRLQAEIAELKAQIAYPTVPAPPPDDAPLVVP